MEILLDHMWDRLKEVLSEAWSGRSKDSQSVSLKEPSSQVSEDQ